MLALPRAGFDRMDLTPRRPSHAFQPPARILDYDRQHDYRPKRPGYARCATYRDLSDSNAPIVDILYRPVLPFRPSFRLSFRARMSQLLDIDTMDTIAAALNFVHSHTGSSTKLCELELTLDFEPERLLELRNTYLPRGRAPVIRADGSWFDGSRRSSTYTRAYFKDENDFQTARVEVVVTRDALRSRGINSLDDLRGTAGHALFALAQWRLRFEELCPPTRRSWPERAHYQALIAAHGVARLRRTLPTKADRERLRRRLQPAPVQYEVNELLHALHARISERLASSSRRSQGRDETPKP